MSSSTYINRLYEALDTSLRQEDESTYLKVHQNKDNSISVMVKSVLVAKIHFRIKSSSFVEVSSKYSNLFPAEFIIDNAIWCKIKLFSEDDIFKYISQLTTIYKNILVATSGEQFGCCSRYEKCSDARKCIHPDASISAACMYKKNLDEGRIFYGKNRNV